MHGHLKKVLEDRTGSGAPLILAIVLAVILISTSVFEYMRLLIIAQGVRDSVQSAIVDVATQNWDRTYPGLREGYSGGYSLSGSEWYENVSSGNVYGRLQSVLGLKQESEDYVKYSGKTVEYRLSGLSLDVKNAPLAPSRAGAASQLNVTGQITVEVPLSFGWEQLPMMRISMQLRSRYVPKF